MLSAPISFSTELCVLGPFLVATTPTGICAVLFGEDTVALEDDLAQRFIVTELHDGSHAFHWN